MNKTNVFLSFMLIGLLVVSAASNPLQAAIPAAERTALIALYNATNGDNWKNNGGWKTPPLHTDGFAMPGTEINWKGITVSGDHVTTIWLDDNNLYGSIPPELGNLSNLKDLELDSNRLSGSIPPELGNLPNLYSLILSSNQLSGGIPPELGNLNSLFFLHLDENQLSGNIPPELGNLPNLYSLSLSSNQLSGGIPPELGNLNGMVYLLLNENLLSGSIPPELGNLSTLVCLFLNKNQLSGSIPKELDNLCNLTTLHLSENQLSGSIPIELENLSNLMILDLGWNDLSGTIPPELGNLSKLFWLYLNNNHLSGSIPPELGNLSSLWDLYLNSNRLTGSIPSELGNLSKLFCFNLSENQLSGNIPSELGNLKYLDDLYLNSNLLTGSIPSELGNLTYLDNLYLNSNLLTGNIPTSLKNLTGLESLSIRYNCLSSEDPDLRVWLNSFDPDWESYQTRCEKEPPFGSFDTPIDGSTVYSSIPVTGWALDDTGIDSVKIYREQGSELVYIGDALMVEGARLDVAEAYPGYIYNTKAGWGYMLLTNFLPNNGNGTFFLHAIATDMVGKTTPLGTKTIHCDNAHAVKPFGAIDTPIQGGTASGSRYINAGWVLTPQPNYIPTDGSTINVYVDGVNLGRPTYNIYRSDIATLFPGYANSNGAVGYFYLDTTAYENGVHTILWTASDSGGNSDGIGSRYFTIQNLAGTSEIKNTNYKIQITNTSFEPLSLQKGYNPRSDLETLYPDENGHYTIEIKELERLVIYLYNRETQGDRIDDSQKGIHLTPNPTSALGGAISAQNGHF